MVSRPCAFGSGGDVVPFRTSALGGFRAFAGTHSGDKIAPEAGIFELQNLGQSAVAFHVGG